MQMQPEDQTQAVMALGRSARRLSWGYFVYVAYYVGIGIFFMYHGVRFSGVGQIAHDLVRLSAVFVPMAGYLAVNAGIGVSLRYFVPMRTAGRWGVAVVAILLALIAAGTFAWSIWRWYEAEFSGGQGMRRLFECTFAAGYVFLAYRVTRITQALHRFVLIEGVWLPKLGSE